MDTKSEKSELLTDNPFSYHQFDRRKDKKIKKVQPIVHFPLVTIVAKMQHQWSFWTFKMT